MLLLMTIFVVCDAWRVQCFWLGPGRRPDAHTAPQTPCCWWGTSSPLPFDALRLSVLNWLYCMYANGSIVVRMDVWHAGVSIFGVILGVLEATKMCELF